MLATCDSKHQPPCWQKLSKPREKAAIDGAREALNTTAPDMCRREWSQGVELSAGRQLLAAGSQPGGNRHGLNPAPEAKTMPAQTVPGGTHTVSPVPLHWIFTDIFFRVPCPVLEDKSYSRGSKSREQLGATLQTIVIKRVLHPHLPFFFGFNRNWLLL